MNGTLWSLETPRWFLRERPAVTGLPGHDLSDLDLAVHRVAPHATVMAVRGEIDMLTAPLLAAELDDQLDPPPVLVVDLTGVSFLGARGVEVLMAARDRAARTAASLRLVYSTRAVARPLEVLHLDEVFPPCAHLADALHYS